MAVQKKKRNIILKGKYKTNQLKKLGIRLYHLNFGAKLNSLINRIDLFKKNSNYSMMDIPRTTSSYFFINCANSLLFFFNLLRNRNFFLNSCYDYSRIKYYNIFLKNNAIITALVSFHDYVLSYSFFKLYRSIIDNHNRVFLNIRFLEKKYTAIITKKIRMLLRWFFYFIDFLNFLLFDYNFIKAIGLSFSSSRFFTNKINYSALHIFFDKFNHNYAIDKIYYNVDLDTSHYASVMSNIIMQEHTMVASPIYRDSHFRYKMPGDYFEAVILDSRSFVNAFSIYNFFKKRCLSSKYSFLKKEFLKFFYFKLSLCRLKRIMHYPQIFIKKIVMSTRRFKCNTLNKKINLNYTLQAYNRFYNKPWRVFFKKNHIESIGYSDFLNYNIVDCNLYPFTENCLDLNLFLDIDDQLWSFHISDLSTNFDNYKNLAILNFKKKLIFYHNNAATFSNGYFNILRLRLVFRAVMLYYSSLLDNQFWFTKDWYYFINYKKRIRNHVYNFMKKSFNFIKKARDHKILFSFRKARSFLRNNGFPFLKYSNSELFLESIEPRWTIFNKLLSKKKYIVHSFIFDGLASLLSLFIISSKLRPILERGIFGRRPSFIPATFINISALHYNVKIVFSYFLKLKKRVKRVSKKSLKYVKINISNRVDVLKFNIQLNQWKKGKLFRKFVNFKSLKKIKANTLCDLFENACGFFENSIISGLSNHSNVFRISKYYSYKDKVIHDDFFHLLMLEDTSVGYTSFYVFKDYSFYYRDHFMYFLNYNLYSNRQNFLLKFFLNLQYFNKLSAFFSNLVFLKFFLNNFPYMYFLKKTYIIAI